MDQQEYEIYLEHILNEMRREFNIPDTAECRIWSKYSALYELIESLSATFQVEVKSCQLTQTNILLLITITLTNCR